MRIALFVLAAGTMIPLAMSQDTIPHLHTTDDACCALDAQEESSPASPPAPAAEDEIGCECVWYDSKTCPHDADQRVFLSGTKVRDMLAAGEAPPPEFSRPEVAKVLIESMSTAGGSGGGA